MSLRMYHYLNNQKKFKYNKSFHLFQINLMIYLIIFNSIIIKFFLNRIIIKGFFSLFNHFNLTYLFVNFIINQSYNHYCRIFKNLHYLIHQSSFIFLNANILTNIFLHVFIWLFLLILATFLIDQFFYLELHYLVYLFTLLTVVIPLLENSNINHSLLQYF